MIELSSLNGANGFELDGVAAGDESGSSASQAGDVNNDGIQDIIIGAPVASPGGLSHAGKTYVVFGKASWSSPISLASLNGTNGFELDGVAANDYSGSSPSAAGDVNNDGIQDIIIGAWGASPGGLYQAGRTYVLFGKANWTSPIAINALNGINGFELDGAAANDNSGFSVSLAGDVNNDGIQDIIIGAPQFTTVGIGKTYVVFGKANWTSPIAISNFNGTNGFELDGVAADTSGSTVSSAGDVNNDGIQDIIIGAPFASSYAGKTYVVFGKASWSSPISLASLNGTNGFELNGESSGDESGYSIGTMGDVNNDGIQDIIIGAPYASSHAGKTYVVFGKSTGWTSPITLSSLNGINGFVLNGVAANDYSGMFISGAGDINNDGIQDIVIGAPGNPFTPSKPGKTYVIFGKATWTSPVDLSSLNGINGFELDGEAPTDASGCSAGIAGDVNHDGVVDIIIGAWGASPGGLYQAGKTYVIFGDSPPVLVNNHLEITQGQSVVLSPNILSAYDLNHNNNSLLFTPSNITGGSFEMLSAPGIALASFTQAQVTSGAIQFVQDGSAIAPSYNMSVTTSGFAFVPPSPANVSFSLASTEPIPILLQNTLTISNGETVTLTSSNLQATQGINDSQLVFIVSNVQQGQFFRMPANITTSNFPQSSIQNGLIEFRHADNQKVPGYSVIVSNGVTSSLPSVATINFAGSPLLQLNPFNITVGQIVILSPQFFNVSAIEGDNPNLVILQVQDLQHATLTSTLTSASVTNFTLSQLEAGSIQLRQDGSLSTPSLTLIATSQSGISSAPNTTNVIFSNQGVIAPRLVNNFLSITQGQTTTLTSTLLQGLQGNGQALPSNAIFYISNVQHGVFSLSNNLGVQVSFFTQSQLQQGLVQFTQDGSSQLPSYSVTVADSGLQSANIPVGIFFIPASQAPQLIRPLVDQKVTVGQPFSFGIQDSFVDPQNEPITLTASVANSTFLPSWINFNTIQQRFSGTAAIVGITNMQVAATDVEGLSTKGYFAIDAEAAPATNTPYLEKALISAGISGGVGLAFYLFKLSLKRAADKKLLESLKQNQGDFDRDVVCPIAEAISKRVKITGFSGVSENTLEEFKGAVRTLISELDARGIDMHIDKMGSLKRDALINEIATQTKLYLSEKRTFGKAFCSFFGAEASPDDIRKAAPNIAARIVEVMEQRQGSQVVMTPLHSSMDNDEPAGMDLKLRY